MISDATLAILAGGRGSRMGGPKDRLTVGGRPILLHLLDQFAFDGPTLLVASPDHPEPVGYERFDRVVLDQTPGLGPLAGIAAAVSATTTDAVCVLSVDMPNVSATQVDWLRATLDGRPDVLGVLGRRRDGDRDRVEPFPSIFRASCGPLVRTELAAGRRALHSLLELDGFVALPTPSAWPASTWLNLNRPEQLFEGDAGFL